MSVHIMWDNNYLDNLGKVSGECQGGERESISSGVGSRRALVVG